MQDVPGIRLLVLDVDGTLVDESNRIRESVTQAIQAAQRRGVKVALATGRSYRSALEVYDSVGSTLPLVCYEGALIYEPLTQVVHRHCRLNGRFAGRLSDELASSIREERVSVHCYFENDLYIWNWNPTSRKYLEGSPVRPIVVPELLPLLQLPSTKVMVLSDDGQIIDGLCRQLHGSECRIQVNRTAVATVLEVFHPQASKCCAVAYLVEHILALDPRHVMAVGDGLNDSELLQYAGIGVAMGNAPPAVQAIADWVAPTVAEDGVAQAIERWILRPG